MTGIGRQSSPCGSPLLATAHAVVLSYHSICAALIPSFCVDGGLLVPIRVSPVARTGSALNFKTESWYTSIAAILKSRWESFRRDLLVGDAGSNHGAFECADLFVL